MAEVNISLTDHLSLQTTFQVLVTGQILKLVLISGMTDEYPLHYLRVDLRAGRHCIDSITGLRFRVRILTGESNAQLFVLLCFFN